MAFSTLYYLIWLSLNSQNTHRLQTTKRLTPSPQWNDQFFLHMQGGQAALGNFPQWWFQTVARGNCWNTPAPAINPIVNVSRLHTHTNCPGLWCFSSEDTKEIRKGNDQMMSFQLARVRVFAWCSSRKCLYTHKTSSSWHSGNHQGHSSAR